MSIDAVTSRISDIQSRIDQFAQAASTPSGIMGQGIIATPADSKTAPVSSGVTESSPSTEVSFQQALTESLTKAGIDTSALSSTQGVTGDAVIAKAKEWIGTPYKWGGNTKDGVDCSGFVKQVLAEFGIDMPRVARQQMKEGTPVASLDEAKAGDLLVFNNGTHIGFYIGDGKMIDAPRAGDKVRVRDVYATPTAIRRVIEESSQVNSAAGIAGTGSATDASAALALLNGFGQTSSAQSTHTTNQLADLLGVTTSSRASFDLSSVLGSTGVGA